MKVVIINGSPRNKGNSSKIVDIIMEELNKESLPAKSYYLEGFKYESCKGCNNCFKNGICHIDDDFKNIYEDIKSSEGIVFVSPTYVSNVPGILKMFIDRSNFVMGQHLTNKRIFNIITYRNAEGMRVKRMLDRLGIFSGGIVTDGLTLKITRQIEDKHVVKIKKIVKMYIKSMKENKPKRLLNKLIHTIVFNIGIKPTVMKNKEDYVGTMNAWKHMKII